MRLFRWLGRAIKEVWPALILLGGLALAGGSAVGCYELVQLQNSNSVLVDGNRINACNNAANGAFFDLTQKLIVTSRGPEFDAVIKQEKTFSRAMIVNACLHQKR